MMWKKWVLIYTVSKDTTSAGDVNGDNVIEHVTMYFSSEPRVQAEINPLDFESRA